MNNLNTPTILRKLVNLMVNLNLAAGLPQGIVKLRQLRSFFVSVDSDQFNQHSILMAWAHTDTEDVVNYHFIFNEPLLDIDIDVKAILSEQSQTICIHKQKCADELTVLGSMVGLLVFARHHLFRNKGDRRRGHEAVEEFFEEAACFAEFIGDAVFLDEPGSDNSRLRSFSYLNISLKCSLQVTVKSVDTTHEFTQFDFTFKLED